MKKLCILITIIFTGIRSFCAVLYTDTAAVRTPRSSAEIIDSLRSVLDSTRNDTLKAAIYNQMVSQYLAYEKLDTKTKKYYQAQALSYTYLALHLYSRLDDTTGLRNSFDALAKVYRSQKKYPQAKWFILQSNTLSRARRDTANIIQSLLVLANIKMDIKDYSLAMRDLDEVYRISQRIRSPKDEALVQQSYVLLYTRLKNYKKANIAAKRQEFIEDSLLNTERLALAKTTDSLQLKKKAQPISKKLSKPSLAKKLASI